MNARAVACTIVLIAGLACSSPTPSRDASMVSRESFLTVASTVAPEPFRSRVPEEPRLVRQGTISLDVDSVENVIHDIGVRVDLHGGFVASCSESVTEDRKSADLVLRIPSARFDVTFDKLRTLGTVVSADIGTTDVSDAYTDLELRLAVKRRTEARLRELLGSRTAKLADVLEVERELDRRVEEIETLERQLERYDEQIELASIDIHLQEPEDAGVLARIERAARSAGRTLAVSLELAVYGTVFVLPWLAAATLGWAIAGRLRRRRAA